MPDPNCPDCKGAGEILLLISMVPCTRCGTPSTEVRHRLDLFDIPLTAQEYPEDLDGDYDADDYFGAGGDDDWDARYGDENAPGTQGWLWCDWDDLSGSHGD